MKRILFLGALLMLSFVGFAQNVENFEVGPYEVDYKGSGDYKFRLRKGIDLYEYFGLKRDTTVNVIAESSSPVQNAFIVGLSVGVPRYMADSQSNVITIGVDGEWKQKIANLLYFNGGLSAALTFCSFGTMPQIGIPISLEISNVDHIKASLYGAIGVVPTFYANAKDKNDESTSGIFIVPKLEVGAYIPMGGQLVRFGGYLSYPEIKCSTGDDVIKERFGRLFAGVNIGFVF